MLSKALKVNLLTLNDAVMLIVSFSITWSRLVIVSSEGSELLQQESGLSQQKAKEHSIGQLIYRLYCITTLHYSSLYLLQVLSHPSSTVVQYSYD